MLDEVNVELDAQQQYAIDQIKAGKNVFISSPAGYGKSEVTRQVSTKNTIVGAPTGQSALNENGSTLHKLFKLPLKLPTQRDFSICGKEIKDLFGADSPVDRFFIGEASMVRKDHLMLINKKLQLARGNPEPWGGLNVCVSGDFAQLPAIVTYEDKYKYQQAYGSTYAFDAPCWDFEEVRLTKSYRTTDTRQLAMLNSIRKGDAHCGRALALLQSEAKPYNIKDDVLHLCFFRKDALDYNMYRFQKHVGISRTYTAKRSNVRDKWNELPVPLDLKLKIGCKVIIKANAQNGDFVNGSCGVITMFHNDFVRVQLDSGVEVDVGKVKYEKKTPINKDGELTEKVDSWVEQIPVCLGWAISSHASQGCTLDAAALDCGKGAFADGLTYTSLSRVRDLTNLSFVRPMSRRDIMTSKEVCEFYKRGD